jgi:hypothetical protein
MCDDAYKARQLEETDDVCGVSILHHQSIRIYKSNHVTPKPSPDLTNYKLMGI